MGMIRSVFGMVSVTLTSADAVSAISCFQQANIPLYEIEKLTELEYSFQIYRSDAKRLRILAEKRGEKLRIRYIPGVYWTLKQLKNRSVLLFGMAILITLSIWVPSRVFFVQVEGNKFVPANQIIEQAQICGISFGASRREVRSEKVKNDLLHIMPELQWAGVNTYGCVAVITVRERNDLQKEEATAGISSVIALRDGVVREMTVRQGSALCKPGQAVKAGEVLVSGYTDCGIYIQAGRAEAEIYAQTKRDLSAVYPMEYSFRQEKMMLKKNYSLIIGKKRINFAKDSGILGGTCAKIETDYSLTLPGGFRLPVRLVVEQIIFYEMRPAVSDSAKITLQSFAKSYLQRLMIAGRIENSAEVFTELEDLIRLDGTYDCYEMIGVSRPEDFINGKND